ncbi:MAG TPA: Ldh family oxidoreductase [Casimicrobiaceae bacterium]|nr:Ldh family oxidoreductase [Casimicrobiaceae bacterium]
MTTVSLQRLESLIELALVGAGASAAMAAAAARALVSAEAQGLTSHGAARVAQYVAHLKNGRANGQALPHIIREKPAACLIDAENGLAFPACELAVNEASKRACGQGIGLAAVTNSHHFGVAAYHLASVAEQSMVGLAFSNSPAAMPAWNGSRALFGTNPIAAVFPRSNAAPLTIDLSLSEVARGKVMVAAQQGKPIPLGWALDRTGKPTTNAKAALDGMMLPAGGVKGAMLALVVELFCVSLTGAHFGYEADSFFVDEGNQPRLGQVFLVIDPAALAGTDVYCSRVEALIDVMCADPDVRLPGQRRADLAQRAITDGVEIAEALFARLIALAGSKPTSR